MQKIQLWLPLVVFLFLLLGYWARKNSTVPPLTEQDMLVLVSAEREATQLLDLRRQRTQQFLAEVQAQIEQKGSNNTSIQWLQNAKQIQTLTSDLLQKVDELKAEAIEKTGGAEAETGIYKGILSQPHWENKDKLSEFYQHLNQYIQKVANIAGADHFAPLTLSPQGEELSFEAFYDLYFESSLPIFLYHLTKLSADITAREKEAIVFISKKVNFIDFQFDRVLPLIVARKLLLTEGERYEAEISVVAASSQQPLKVHLEEGELVEEKGSYKIKFKAKATPEEYDRIGLAHKVLRGKITVALPTGRDTTLFFEEPYIVRKRVGGVEQGASSENKPENISDLPLNFQ
jgi:hypothetical protein